MDAWQISPEDFPRHASPQEQLRFLARYAVVAPSSHNSEPWQFSIDTHGVGVYADRRRWLAVADPDQRELYLSVGCALENLLVAAEHFGFRHDVDWFPQGEEADCVAQVHLEPGGEASPWRPPELFSMLTVRHTSHQLHTSGSVPEADIARLRQCCNEEGVVLYVTSDHRFRQRVAELIAEGDRIQFADPAFRRELAGWIRRGVFGTPWLTSKLYAWTVRWINIGRTQARRDAELVGSSPLVAVLSAVQADPQYQARVGQVFERVALLAASMGLWTQPMSQLLEVLPVRDELVRLLPPSRMVPQHAFRMGYGPAERCHTPRRPLDEMLR
jgi:nitroreductase